MSTLVFLRTLLVVSICTRLVSSEVCLTDECRNTSQQILDTMNMSADPCVDMYNFACGGWLEQHDIPDGQRRWSKFEIIRENINKQLAEF
ncbi:NEDD8 protease Nep2 [Bulinus truncatus]|nr:NEDD8 protease Nep2 [Bulinus truncatus]